MRNPVKEKIKLSIDRDIDNAPDCYGVLFNATSGDCLQCQAFRMCGYATLSATTNKTFNEAKYQLDESRILYVTDADIVSFVKDEKPVKDVVRWLMEEGRTIDKIAAIQRLKRALRDSTNLSYKNSKVSVC